MDDKNHLKLKTVIRGIRHSLTDSSPKNSKYAYKNVEWKGSAPSNSHVPRPFLDRAKFIKKLKSRSKIFLYVSFL